MELTKSMLTMLAFVWLVMLREMENALHALSMPMKKMDNATVTLIIFGMKSISNAIQLSLLVLHDLNGTRKSSLVNVLESMNF